MKKALFLFLALSPLLAVAPLWAAGSTNEDTRQLAVLPPAAQAIMRADMIDHLAALNEVIGYLGEGKLGAAAETAESRLGRSAMGRSRGAAGMGPGRFMPDAMRSLGWNMHAVASDFAKAAKEGDQAKAYAALQPVTASCVACHLSYRIR